MLCQAEMLRIGKKGTICMQPQSDGIVEKFNASLKTNLKMYVNDHHTDWDRYIPLPVLL